MTIVQPCNAVETRAAVEWALGVADENVALRFVIGPSPRVLELPEDYQFSEGRGAILKERRRRRDFRLRPGDAARSDEGIGGIGRKADFGLRVVNMPWLNQHRRGMGSKAPRSGCDAIWVLEDHSPVGRTWRPACAKFSCRAIC